MLRTILYDSDGAHYAFDALSPALKIAKESGAEADVGSVKEVQPPGPALSTQRVRFGTPSVAQ
jgi:hypothetical protein